MSLQQKSERSPTPPVSVPAVIIKANEFHVDTQTPCRFVFVIPLELPPLLDPSIPPPPYYPPDNTVDRHALRDATMTVLRPVIIGALYTLLGPDAAVSKMVSDKNCDWRQRDEFVGGIVTDRSKFDLESGNWTDQHGVEGFGAKAYIDLGGSRVEIVEGYKIRADQGIEDNKTNPLVVEVKAMPVLQDGGKVGFVARRYRDTEQEHFNHLIWQEEW